MGNFAKAAVLVVAVSAAMTAGAMFGTRPTGSEPLAEIAGEGAVTASPGEVTPPDVTIRGDQSCVVETTAALSLLRDKADAHYAVVLGHVGVIECAEAGSGMYAWESPPRYLAGRATLQAGTIWYAGMIAHDACHAKQYQEYVRSHPTQPVPQGVFSGEQAEAECLSRQHDALVRMGEGQEALDTVEAALGTRYWEVDYEERWW